LQSFLDEDQPRTPVGLAHCKQAASAVVGLERLER
jgi:hypothetical protein